MRGGVGADKSGPGLEEEGGKGGESNKTNSHQLWGEGGIR